MAANAEEAGSRFGGSVAVSGDTALVGAWSAPSEFDEPTNGSVYVYRRTDDVWAQETVLVAPGEQPTPEFGRSVAIDGDVAVVGAAGGGSVYVFERVESVWRSEAVLDSEDLASGSHFGVAVTIDGDTIVVGAPGRDEHAGSAYVFRRTSAGWSGVRRLAVPAAAPGLELGGALALDGTSIVLGAAGDSTGGNASGSVYIHQLP